MKTLREIEVLENLFHQTGKTGAALQLLAAAQISQPVVIEPLPNRAKTIGAFCCNTYRQIAEMRYHRSTQYTDHKPCAVSDKMINLLEMEFGGGKINYSRECSPYIVKKVIDRLVEMMRDS